ncbi:MAG: NAD(P)/FAD-dependent oxidoreductase [Holophagales bacterium]|nr:NAD(P)/FAD-dependent oxidoreductase [Holophagales bacterium]
MSQQRTAVIVGAGPAGLTAAYELATRSDVKPVVLERSGLVGGIARTVTHNGNRIDLGGHRFFSKSDRVMDWWLSILPLERGGAGAAIAYQGKARSIGEDHVRTATDDADLVMLLRERRSRIYHRRRFFDYPIRLSLSTFRNLGLVRSVRIGASYLRAVVRPVAPERNLEDFLVNRFGRELYRTFFRDYTEKVWGVPCGSISAEWGAQRIRGLSVAKAIRHRLQGLVRGEAGDLSQKAVETSLIERFLYPRLGPGQLWEEVARRVEARGGEVRLGCRVDGLTREGERLASVSYTDGEGRRHTVPADVVLSTMPLRHLVRSLDPPAPPEAAEVAAGLVYRDFITVGLLVDRLEVEQEGGGLIQDNWIYIQEPDVLVGRMQVFNNWSPGMVADRSKAWIGLEYFCNAGDEVWRLDDEAMIALAVSEMERIGIVDPLKVRDGVVIRVPKAYPTYLGSYDRLPRLRAFLDGIPNLWVLGRNGMHRYNNQDHSMLTAMTAVDNILAGRTDTSNVWDINTESDHHEERAAGGG